MGDEYDFQEEDLVKEARALGKLLKEALKSKDALLKALKVLRLSSTAGANIHWMSMERIHGTRNNADLKHQPNLYL
jgi:hypothetical protein